MPTSADWSHFTAGNAVRLLLVLLLASSCASASLSQIVQRGKENRGDLGFNLYLGQSTLHGDDSFPVDTEDLLGISLTAIDREHFSVGAEMGYFYKSGSRDDVTVPGSGTFDFTSRTDELFVGLWAPLETESFWHPYVGAGVEAYSIRAHQTSPAGSSAETDKGAGAYAHAGVLFDLWDHLQWGVDLRAVWGNRTNLFGIHTYADYTQAALTLSYTL